MNTELKHGQRLVKEFKPENTAISKGNSKSAEMLINDTANNEIVLDYGIGVGRNVKYMLEKREYIEIHGTDIVEQLVKENAKHNELRERGCIITESKLLNNESYDKVLNSHVLNVIAEDTIKNFVVNDIYNKLKKGGKAYFEVRTKSDVESAKTKEVFGNGYKIKKGKDFTYQEAISKEKMKDLIEANGFIIMDHICNSSRHIVVATK